MSVVDAYTAVGGIPQPALMVLDDVVDAVVDEALPVEIFVLDEGESVAERNGEVYAS